MSDDLDEGLLRPIRGAVTGMLIVFFVGVAALPGAAYGAAGVALSVGCVLWLFVEALGGRRLVALARVAAVFAFAAVTGFGTLAWCQAEGDGLGPFKAALAALIGAGVAGSALLAPGDEVVRVTARDLGVPTPAPDGEENDEHERRAPDCVR